MSVIPYRDRNRLGTEKGKDNRHARILFIDIKPFVSGEPKRACGGSRWA